MRPALFHQPDESIEQVIDIVRSGTRFGMALETKRRLVRAGKALQAAVEQGNMRDFHVCRQGAGVHRESADTRMEHASSARVGSSSSSLLGA